MAYPQPDEQQQQDHILWSCVARNDTILAEAAGLVVSGSSGSDSAALKSVVAQTGQELLAKRRTPGWEFHTSSRTAFVGFRDLHKSFGPSSASSSSSKKDSTTTAPPPPAQQQKQQRLKGVKFHLYQHDPDARAAAGTTDKNDKNDSTNSSLIVWVFAAVYDGSRLSKSQVQSFVEKIVLTEMFRETSDDWKHGDTLAAQSTFAPILLQRMQEVTYLGKMALLEDRLDSTRATMQSNIELILEQEERLRVMNDDKATRLQDMAKGFRKNTKRVRRLKMLQDAKHGLLVGAAITGVVAIIVVPPLVAIL